MPDTFATEALEVVYTGNTVYKLKKKLNLISATANQNEVERIPLSTLQQLSVVQIKCVAMQW